jgi:hypothetical protein
MTDDIDHRLVFLERAAARLCLVEACLMNLDEAYTGLVNDLRWCHCECQIAERLERLYPRRQRPA